MNQRKISSVLRISGPLSIVAVLLGGGGCEKPLNIIVSTTNLPADSDGLEFLVRTVTFPMGGKDAVQAAAETPPQRIRFADNESNYCPTCQTDGRVLKDLVDQRPDPEVVVQLLKQSPKIGSAYERAEVLLAVARTYRIEGTLHDAYVDAAQSIGSDYERNRALAAAASARRVER